MPVPARVPSGWLAIMLALGVISLCLGLRLGLNMTCAYAQPHSAVAEQIWPTAAADTQFSTTALTGQSAEHGTEPGSCSLSEHLLSKVWHPLDPLFTAILLLFALWWSPQASHGFARRTVSPLLFPGRRRHLVLCVFRE